MSQQEKEISFYNLFIPLTTKKCIIFISLIGFFVFFNMLFNGFVWDDVTYIIFNPEIHNFNLLHLFGVNEFNSSGYYRPVPAIYFTILYNFFNTQTFFYHFFQLLLHIINTCLLFYFFKKVFHQNISFFLSLVFLIHPIQVESVTYIGASQSELYFFFGMLALLFSYKKHIYWQDLLVITFLLLCALLTKETGGLFIIVVLIFQFLYHRKRILLFLPYTFSVIAIYSLIRFSLAHVYLEKNNFIPLGHFSLLGRLINIPAIIFYYLKTFFYPSQLSIDQLWTISIINFQNFYYPLIMDLIFFSGIGFLGIYVYKRKKVFLSLYILFSLWLILGLSLILQVYPLDMTVAERWFYFPIVGILGIFGITAQTITVSNNTLKKSLYVLAVLIISTLSIRTMVRNTNWVNGVTLYSHDAHISDNFDIENNLGTQLAITGNYKAALPHIIIAVREFPHDTNLYDLGSIYENLNDYKNAEKYYELVLNDNDISKRREEVKENAYASLARVLTLHEQPAIAKAFLKKVLQLYPTNGSYWAYLAICEYSMNEQKSALISAEKAKELLQNQSTEKLYLLILNHKTLNLTQ